MSMNETLAYYNENAQTFVEGTVQADMSTVRNHFLSFIPPTGHILDAGCGSGRDSKAFLEAGYQVTAMDGSETLCQKASTLIGQPVQHRYFQQVDEVGVYDGIWACATLLHVPSAEIEGVLQRMVRALKSNGYFYLSFKYGTFEGMRNGRYFTDYTEASFDQVLACVADQVTVIATDLTVDVRPDREERWLNIIIKKK